MRGSALRRNHAEGVNEIELESMIGKPQEDEAPLVALASPSARNGFIRKVFGILAAQLTVTLFVGALFVLHGRQWLKSNPSAVIGALSLSSGVSLGISLICACCPEVMRRSPGNYIILAVFTLAESVLVGVACLHYTAGSVLFCVGLTALVVFGLTVYALRTNNDFTTAGPYLFTALLVLCGTGFLMWAVSAFGYQHSPLFGYMQVAYAAGGALLFSFFIIYDMQMVVGGNHKHEFSIDDYAMAAMCLYIDILQLFLSLLQLLGRAEDDGL